MKKVLLVFVLLFLGFPFLTKAFCCQIKYTCGWFGYSLNKTYTETTTNMNCQASLANLETKLTTLKGTLNSSITDNKCSCAPNAGDKVIIDIGAPGKAPIWINANCTGSDNGAVATVSEFDKSKCVDVKPPDKGSAVPNTTNPPVVGGSVRSTYKTLPNPLGPTSWTIMDLPKIIGKVLNAIIAILGAVALLIFVYGGFTWMTAAGNDTKVQTGKNILLWATIAIVIIFLSWMLVAFMFQALGV